MILVMTGDFLYASISIRRMNNANTRKFLLMKKPARKLSTDQKDTKKDWEDTLKEFSPGPDDLKKEIDAHRGSYFQLLGFRSQQVFSPAQYPHLSSDFCSIIWP